MIRMPPANFVPVDTQQGQHRSATPPPAATPASVQQGSIARQTPLKRSSSEMAIRSKYEQAKPTPQANEKQRNIAGMALRGKNFDAIKFAATLRNLSPAELDKPDATGYSPLSTAVIHGNEVAQKLLKGAGASMEAHNADGSSAALLAAKKAEFITPDFENTFKKQDPAGQLVGFTQNLALLHMESYVQGKLVFPDPEQQKTYLAQSPADISAGVMMGLKACGDMSQQIDRPNMDVSDVAGEYQGKTLTMLQASALRGEVNELKSVVAIGADLNVKEASTGRTALHMTVADVPRKETAQALEGLKTLVASGADINAVDSEGNTPLHLAAVSGNVEAYNLLVAAQADSGKANLAGDSPATLLARQQSQAA